MGRSDSYHPGAEYSEDEGFEFHVSDKDLALWRIDQQIAFVQGQATSE